MYLVFESISIFGESMSFVLTLDHPCQGLNSAFALHSRLRTAQMRLIVFMVRNAALRNGMNNLSFFPNVT